MGFQVVDIRVQKYLYLILKYKYFGKGWNPTFSTLSLEMHKKQLSYNHEK